MLIAVVIAVRNSHVVKKAQNVQYVFSLISDDSSFKSIVIGVSIGVGVLIAVVFGLAILWVLMRRTSRKENTTVNFGMR